MSCSFLYRKLQLVTERIFAMRIMGVDYGDARTGVAFSDLLCSIVGSTAVIPSRNKEKLLADLVRLAKEQDVTTIVVGLPRNMDGTEGPRAELCREFAKQLQEATCLEVVLWDERRSSIEAHAILHANGRKMKDHRKKVDAVAATLMLEGYLGRF